MYLRKEGFRVLKAGTGEDGLAAAKRERPRLVVLDVGLPGIDGLEVCRRLRADASLGGGGVPVIFLTARDSEIDRILGLEMGADDYLTKPFSPRELVARVKAILRRSQPAAPAPEVIEIGGAVIDLGRREVRVLGARGAPDGAGEVVDFTGKGFELLRYLAENAGPAPAHRRPAEEPAAGQPGRRHGRPRQRHAGRAGPDVQLPRPRWPAPGAAAQPDGCRRPAHRPARRRDPAGARPRQAGRREGAL